MKYKKYLNKAVLSLIAAFCISSFSGCVTLQPISERYRRANLREIVSHPDYFTNSIGMKFARIPAGEFMMGTEESKHKHTHWRVNLEERERYLKFYCDDERPRHLVRITNDFYMQTTEVTREQFSKFVEDTGYVTDVERNGLAWIRDGKGWKKDYSANWRLPHQYKVNDNHPVTHLEWLDANEFCKWLSKKEKCNYRLPTEAEWEYACRAGTTTDYNTGSNVITHDDANFKGAGGKDVWEDFSPVGSFKPNNWGLYDMHGSAWEFCSDWFDEEYYYHTPKEDPRGYIVEGTTNGFYHSERGGGWNSGEMDLRSANRTDFYIVGCDIGFRCAVDFRAEKKKK